MPNKVQDGDKSIIFILRTLSVTRQNNKFLRILNNKCILQALLWELVYIYETLT